MHKLVLGIVAALAVTSLRPAFGEVKSPHKDSTTTAEKTTGAAPLDKEAQQKLKEHLRMRAHIAKGVKYPATKESLVVAFKGFRDVKPDDRKWFEETLPARTYETPEDVMRALGWEVAPSEMTSNVRNGK